MKLSNFGQKLNKIDGNVYTIEEEITLIDGVYEADLEHENVDPNSISVYTGSKLTGQQINTWSKSTPSLNPCRTHIKVYSTITPLYITYETIGDTVEADDMNDVQNAIIYTQTESNTENIPSQEDIEEIYRVDLSRYIPRFVYNTDKFNEIYKSQEYELGLEYWQNDDVLKQCFIDTATWGLTLWEEEYGIKTNLNSSYEERREVIKAKKRGQGTCTKALIKNVTEAFSGGECRVIENTAPYTFTIQFVGVKGIPKNMKGLISAIDEIKPAHLVYNFKYTYTSWDYLESKNLTHDDTDKITWDDLEIYD